MGMITNNRRMTSGGLAEINITPLCDVLLVLLIIFMVTAPLLSQGIDVNLPQARGKEVERTQSDIILTMRRRGNGFRIYLNNSTTPIAIDDLDQRLKEALTNAKQKDVFLRADRAIQYGDVARVMAITKLAGAQRIGMMTRPEGR